MLGLFNIVIFLILIHTTLNLFGFKGPNILSCGLFSYLGARDSHNFNWDKFNALGLDNDERGGDSVGRAVGDDVRKFVNSKKVQTTYKDYVINHKNGDGHHIAIGHTRKASVGIVSEATAQPVVIDIPGGGKFIMVHNGTLFNWEALALKYGVVKTGKSDSMVLAEIIFQFGYDVLKEYEGAASLIIRDDRTPDTVMVFRGRSKAFNGRIDDERPLYYYNEGESSIYISSREEGLYFIGGDIDTVEEFNANMLYFITNGKIVSQLLYDRTECSQIRVWETVTTNKPFNTRGSLPTLNDGDNINYAYSERRTYIIKKDYIYKPQILGQIVPGRLRYYFYDEASLLEKYANGIVILNEKGIRNMGSRKDGEKIYYFYSGIMLKDKRAHSEVLRIFGKSKKFIDTDENICKISKYATHPVCTVDNDIPIYSNAREYKSVYDPMQKKMVMKAVYYDGTFTPLFSKKTYVFKSGDNIDIKYNTDMNCPDHDEKIESKVIVLPQYSGLKRNYSANNMDMPKWAEKYCSEEDDEDFSNQGINDVFYPTSEIDPEDLDFPEDLEDDVRTDHAVKALEDGLQCMLMAVDETIENIETTALNGKFIATVLANLYELQDALLEKDKFKKNNLVATYDEF